MCEENLLILDEMRNLMRKCFMLTTSVLCTILLIASIATDQWVKGDKNFSKGLWFTLDINTRWVKYVQAFMVVSLSTSILMNVLACVSFWKENTLVLYTVLTLSFFTSSLSTGAVVIYRTHNDWTKKTKAVFGISEKVAMAATINSYIILLTLICVQFCGSGRVTPLHLSQLPEMEDGPDTDTENLTTLTEFGT